MGMSGLDHGLPHGVSYFPRYGHDGSHDIGWYLSMKASSVTIPHGMEGLIQGLYITWIVAAISLKQGCTEHIQSY